MALDKPIGEISKVDLDQLITAQVPEGKTIEYKTSLPAANYADKREFLADVTSLANSTGGHLLFGVEENQGIPTNLSGVNADDFNIQRLENLLRDGVQPRLSGVEIGKISVTDSTSVVVLKVPRSWTLPHRVVLGGHDKFYGRNAAGKYPLDVPELRALFALSATTADRLREFRNERILKINADDGSLPLGRGPKTILHIVPLGAFTLGTNFNVTGLTEDLRDLAPIKHDRSWSHRHNFDGLVIFSKNPDSQVAHGYVQVFRNGCIEAVDGTIVKERDGQMIIPGNYWEEALIVRLPHYVQTQKRLGVQPPLGIMVSLTGVQSYLINPGMPQGMDFPVPIDRDILLLPEFVLETIDSFDAHSILRPAFDAVSNASGLPRSFSYGEDGRWHKFQ